MTDLDAALDEAIAMAVDCGCYDDGDGRVDEMVDFDMPTFLKQLDHLGVYLVTAESLAAALNTPIMRQFVVGSDSVRHMLAEAILAALKAQP